SALNTSLEHPELSEKLRRKQNELSSEWDHLREAMSRSLTQMIQMHRAIIFQDGCVQLQSWLDKFDALLDAEEQRNKTTQEPAVRSKMIKKPNGDESLDGFGDWPALVNDQPACESLAEANAQFYVTSAQLEQAFAKQQLLDELLEHFEILKDTVNLDSAKVSVSAIPEMIDVLQNRYWKINRKLQAKHAQLSAQKFYHQLLRDLEIEKIWAQEKTILAESQEVGRSLLAVNQLIRRHRLLIKEVTSRSERITLLLEDAEFLVTQCLENVDTQDIVHESCIGTSATAYLVDNNGVRFRLPMKVLTNLAKESQALKQALANLDEMLTKRTALLEMGYQCFHQLSDFVELREWLQETENTVLLQSRASRDTETAKVELKKHENIELRVNDLLARSVRDFNIQTAKLISQTKDEIHALTNQLTSLKAESSPSVESQRVESEARQQKRQFRARIKHLSKRSEALQAIQATVDRQYAGLRDVCVEKRQRLEEILALNALYDEVADLEAWLNQKVSIAAASITGRDLPECLTMLAKFVKFTNEVLGESLKNMTTESFGIDLTCFPQLQLAVAPLWDKPGTVTSIARVDRVVRMCRRLIQMRHSDAPLIAFWQDRLTETLWDLNELTVTRLQQLVAAAQRFAYLMRCNETDKRVCEKEHQLPESMGRELEALCQQLSRHAAFEQDMQILQIEVDWVKQTADRLLPLYAGKWTGRLTNPRDKLSIRFEELKWRTRVRRRRLEESITFHKWLAGVTALLRWTDKCEKQLDEVVNVTREQTALLFSTNQQMAIESVKVQIQFTLQCRDEINARKEKLEACLESGQALYNTFYLVIEQAREVVKPMVDADSATPEPVGETYVTDFGDKTLGTIREEDSLELQHTKSLSTENQNAGPSLGADTLTTTDPDDLSASDETHRQPSGALQDESSVQSVRSTVEPKTSDDDLGEIKFEPKGMQTWAQTRKSHCEEAEQIKPAQDICDRIQSSMQELATSWYNVRRRWFEVSEFLHLQLSAVLFMREAHAADHWLELHERDVWMTDLGDSIKSTLMLIRRQDALEHNLALQTDRFERLKQPTRLELVRLYGHPLENEGVRSETTPVGHASMEVTDQWKMTEELYFRELWQRYQLADPTQKESDGSGSSGSGSEIMTDTANTVPNGRGEHISMETFGDNLARKHELQSHAVRARDRKWYDLYVVVEANVRQLLVYRQKSSFNPNEPCLRTFHGEPGIPLGPQLLHTTLAQDYTKRAYVFRVQVTNTGAQYLFQAPTPEILKKFPLRSITPRRLLRWIRQRSRADSSELVRSRTTQAIHTEFTSTSSRPSVPVEVGSGEHQVLSNSQTLPLHFRTSGDLSCRIQRSRNWKMSRWDNVEDENTSSSEYEEL
ncbi:spectrin repeat-containing domain protein, partial [Opisthorchis viverrini]